MCGEIFLRNINIDCGSLIKYKETFQDPVKVYCALAGATAAHVSCEILNLRCNMDCERLETGPGGETLEILMSAQIQRAARILVSEHSQDQDRTGKYRTQVVRELRE